MKVGAQVDARTMRGAHPFWIHLFLSTLISTFKSDEDIRAACLTCLQDRRGAFAGAVISDLKDLSMKNNTTLKYRHCYAALAFKVSGLISLCWYGFIW